MKLNYSFARISDKDLRVLITISSALTLFLFFIDEGNYNLKWMEAPFEWLIFMIYFAFILTGQFIVSILVPKYLANTRWKWLRVLVGTVCGLMFLITVVFG